MNAVNKNASGRKIDQKLLHYTHLQGHSAVETDFIDHEEIFPFRTDDEELRGNEFHKFIQLALRDPACVRSEDTAAFPGQPDLCAVWRGLTF